MINPGTGEKPLTRSPFTPLHPTLKACKCGFIGTRSQLYKHFNREQEPVDGLVDMDARTFFTLHGEVPLNEDDPRTLLH
jgi:hypothetical protein